ncbi:DUF853 family protein [Pseudomonas aeruginosa]|nr:DUF853 family protein [Pseudomonas aeruginosa]
MPWPELPAEGLPGLPPADHRREDRPPVATTISEMGPLLLANLLELTDSQQAALFAAFQVADRKACCCST